MQKMPLTLEEIRTLVAARERLELAHAERQHLLLNGPDNEQISVNKMNSFQEMMKRAHNNAMNELIAQHLFHDDAFGAPLVSSDAPRIVEMALYSLKAQNCSGIEWEQLLASKKLWTTTIERSIDTMDQVWRAASQNLDLNPHEAFWRWVSVVQALATHYQLSAEQFLEQDTAYDHITRQMYTREQFIRRNTRELDAVGNSDVFLECMAGPKLATIKDPIQNQIIRALLRVELAEDLQVFRADLERYYASELARIYGGS